MKNKLTDLNNHLFAQLERLSDESITDDSLKREIERTSAITTVARNIIENARLILDAHKSMNIDRVVEKELPALLSGTRE